MSTISRPGDRAGTRTKATTAAAVEAGPSREARRLAAVLLEVLAGVRTTGQAAATLGISLVRYYQLETVALRGLVTACEPRPRGRLPSPQTELAALRKERERLQRELARQQSLVRLAQRAVGVPPPTATPAAKGKRRRRPMVRALRVAAQLRGDDNETQAAPAASQEVPNR